MNLFKLLQLAVERGIISAEQQKQLGALSQEVGAQKSSSAMSNVLFYGGGVLALLAMAVTMAAGFESFGWGGMAVMLLIYGGASVALVRKINTIGGMRVATSMLAMLPVLIVPFFIYAVQNMLGLWHFGYNSSAPDYSVVVMLLGALATAGAMYRWIAQPMQLLPILATVWCLMMELFGSGDIFFLSYGDRMVTTFYGLGVLGLSIWLDMRSVGTGKDMSFWGYIVAASALLGGLTILWDGGEGGRLVFAAASAGMVIVGGMLARRIMALYGAIGVGAYIVYTIATSVDSLGGAAIMLITLAGGVIWLGMLWYKHEEAIMARLRSVLPQGMQDLIEQRLRSPV